MEQDDVRKTWKDYFKELYNVFTEEMVAVNICDFDGALVGNYFEIESMRMTKVEVGVKKITTVKAECKDECDAL